MGVADFEIEESTVFLGRAAPAVGSCLVFVYLTE
jgi:hypothetical protein